MGSESKVDLITSQRKGSESCQSHGLGCFGDELLPGSPAVHCWHVSGTQKELSSEDMSVPVADKGTFATDVSPC